MAALKSAKYEALFPTGAIFRSIFCGPIASGGFSSANGKHCPLRYAALGKHSKQHDDWPSTSLPHIHSPCTVSDHPIGVNPVTDVDSTSTFASSTIVRAVFRQERE